VRCRERHLGRVLVPPTGGVADGNTPECCGDDERKRLKGEGQAMAKKKLLSYPKKGTATKIEYDPGKGTTKFTHERKTKSGAKVKTEYTYKDNE